MALYLRDGTEESNIRGLVENCAHNDDITPLVRLLFEAQSLADSPAAIAADGQQMVSIISQALKAVAAEQAAVIDDACHSNATAIAQTVAELEKMNASVQEVKAALQGANQSMQSVGSQLVENVQNVNRLAEVQQNLQQAAAAVRAAQGVLEQCLLAGQLISEHQLYPALCMLDKIRRKHLATLLAMLSNKGRSPQQMGSDSATPGPPSSSYQLFSKRLTGREQEHLQQLHAFFSSLVDDMTAAVHRLALQGFNQWLVSMRAHARDIGLMSIQAAAVERSLEADLALERKALLAALTGTGRRSVWGIASELSKAPFRQDLLRDAIADQQKAAAAAAQHNQKSGGAVSSSGGLAALSSGGLRELLKRPSKKSPTNLTTAAAGGPSSSSSSAAAAQIILDEVDDLYPGEPEKAIRALVQQQKTTTSSTLSNLSRLLQQQSHEAAEGYSSSSSSSTASQPVHSFLDLDMTGLHSAVHVARCLGRLDTFREHYLDQRRLQISADLQQPLNFLESYQTYLAQVTGFFVMESFVQRVTDGLVGPAEAAMLWSGAVRPLKATLETALDQLASAPLMLMVKDFVVLACVALGRAGYRVAPVTEVLLSAQGRYHDLLAAQLQKQLIAAVDTDVLAELEIRTESQHNTLTLEYGLPWQLEGAAPARKVLLSPSGVPPLPYTAPYTASVPQVLSLVQRFVSDSLAYLRGLYSPGELLPAVLHQRDRMLSKVLLEVLSAKARSVGSSEEMLRECMRVAANAWALKTALDALDDWTIDQVKPEAASSAVAAAAAQATTPGAAFLTDASSTAQATQQTAAAAAAKLNRARNRKAAVASGALSSTAQTALGALQEASERDVLKGLAARIDQLLEGIKKADWQPAEPLPGSQSEWVNALLSAMQETFDAGLKLLPRSSVVNIMRLALRATAAGLMRIFGPEGVRAYNLYAVEKLAINVVTIKRFADRWGVVSLEEELSAPNQLCQLLLSGKIEDVLDPHLKRQQYNALELSVVAAALDRYREAKKQPQQWPTRKGVDAVSKQLRAQVAGQAGI